MKKTTLFALVFALFLSFGCGKESNKPENTENGIQKAVTSLGDKQIKYKNEKIEVELNIPLISGMKDQALQEKINRNFETEIITFKDEVEKSAEEELIEQENWMTIYPYQAYVSYELPYNKNHILSIIINYYSYTGGAHGMTVRKTLNINTDSGKILEIKDFFPGNGDYQQIVLEEVRRQIESEQDNYYANTLDNLDSLPEDLQFYLEEGKIIVYFGLYEIAPYAAGIPEFPIPLDPYALNHNELI